MLANRLSVFFVEDNELYAMMLELKLKNVANYSITVFDSAEKAINRLDENPDLIILDYFLNGINGLEALKKIKSVNPKIPVIILSAQNDINIAMDTMDAGAYKYLAKKELSIEKINKVLNKFSSDKLLNENNFFFPLKINKQNLFISVIILSIIGLIISIT